MNDPRIRNHARILVNYSIGTRKADTVGVNGNVLAEPLIVSIYEELIKAGAFPVIRMLPEGVSEILFRKGQPHHFRTIIPFQYAYARCMDATIGITSEENTRSLSAVDPKKQALMSKTMKPVADIRRKKKWVLTLFPTNAYAQDAEMSLDDFEDFVYSAIFADEKDPIAQWKALRKRQAKLIAALRGTSEIRIVGGGTDIKFSVKSRKFINSDGHRNMPSGEIFTAPVESSVEGFIEYDYPVCRSGREIDGIRLVFRKGVVVEATASKNEMFLKEMLKTDAGALRLGEFGIGTNTRIQRFIKNILFDEKIGGTIHLALGQSYAETGGKNKSAIHWDMIKDLRKGGAIYMDGKVFQKDGKFLLS
ncbi:MAG: aminopeptidase [Kiritimatiellae bacterium]|nr:aminopeptidase [Kiritimatiellia bacterium]MDD5520912.1 aminopeptidase [Kiritimatiellia bacterium]